MAERNAIRLSRPHEWTVYAVLSLVFVSGAAWGWLQHFGRHAGQFGQSAHPMEPWMQKVHGGSAMLALILLGTLLISHVWRAWQARRNRRTGGLLFIIFALLIVSGYALYYSGNENVRVLVSRTHLWIGLLFPLLVILHVWRGKRTRLSANEKGRTPFA